MVNSIALFQPTSLLSEIKRSIKCWAILMLAQFTMAGDSLDKPSPPQMGGSSSCCCVLLSPNIREKMLKILLLQILMFFFEVGAEVHPRAVPPAEERLASLVLTYDEIFRCGHGFIVDGFHALLGEWAKVLNGLAALAIRFAFKNTTRAELFTEGFPIGQDHVSRIIRVFRLFFGI